MPGDDTPRRFQILVCDGPSCGITHESERFKAQIAARRAADPALAERVSCVDFTCFGFCDDGPNVLVRELAPAENPWAEPKPGALEGVQGLYLGNDEAKVDRILDEHVLRGAALADVRAYG
jgi:(2Fe-2S) ferredoxin